MAAFLFGVTLLTVLMKVCHSASSETVGNLLLHYNQGLPNANLSKLLPHSRSKREALIVNELTDPMLDNFRINLLRNRENIVDVSDFSRTLSVNIFGEEVNYLTFEGYNAKIKDISTIYRIGDVLLQLNDRGMGIRFRFGFSTLEYSCDSYLLNFSGLKISGNLRVIVDENEMFFEGTIHKDDDKCTFEVDTIRVEKMNDLRVKLNGFKALDGLMNLVVESVLGFFKGAIKSAVEKELVKSLIKAIETSGVINKVVDELLKYSREAIIDANLDRIPVPDISKTFVGPIGTQGHFLATNGSVAYLSTVQRTGNAHMISGKSSVTLILNLGLQQLTVDFDSYEAKYMDIGPRGKMRVTVAQNSIYAVLSLKYNLVNCTQELITLIIDQFGGIDVKMTGLDPFNWLIDEVVTWVASDFKNIIKGDIESGLRQSITQALTKYNICKYLPHIHHSSTT